MVKVILSRVRTFSSFNTSLSFRWTVNLFLFLMLQRWERIDSWNTSNSSYQSVLQSARADKTFVRLWQCFIRFSFDLFFQLWHFKYKTTFINRFSKRSISDLKIVFDFVYHYGKIFCSEATFCVFLRTSLFSQQTSLFF
jgi:hypothetical protein